MQRDHPGSVAGAAAPTSGGYLPALDGLRAISVAAVLLYHADMRWIPGGFLGVEVFFVISGYLITMLLVREHERTSTISFRGFWLRRARRLLAAVYVLLATVSLVVLVFYREDASKLAGQVWAALTYVMNWFLIVADQSYFATVERPLVFQHLWSLAIEEQFYLVWPVLLLAMLRLFRGRLIPMAGLITAGAVASLVWMAVLYEPAVDPSRVYYGTDTRASGLLLGAALALLWKPGHSFYGDVEVKRVSLDMAGLGAVGVIVWCFGSIEETESFLYRGGFAVLSIATCVVIAAAVQPRTALGRLLGQPAFVWIGKRSYSLYLWHWPIYVYTQPEIDLPLSRNATLVLRLVLTVVAAEVSYRFVEVPIRNGAFARWRRRLRRREGARRFAGPLTLAGSSALLLVAVNTVGVSGSSGFDQLVGQGTVPPASAPAAGTGVTAAPGTTTPVVTPSTLGAVASTLPPAPTTSATPQQRTVTVIGDSVLKGVEEQLTAELEASGYIVDYRVIPAWMLDQADEDIAASGQVGDTVIMGLGHNTLWEKDRANFDNWARKFDREADALVATLERLGATKIVWVTLREPSESVIPPQGQKQYRLYIWYFPYVNERLRLLVQRHPEIILADWAAVSNHEGLTYDAMHLTSSGIRLMIDTIRTAGGI